MENTNIISTGTGIKSIQIGNINEKNISTLGELLAALPSTKGVKTPTYKALREQEPVLQKTFPDGGLWVYRNGFAAYKSGKHITVLRVARARSHTYEFSDANSNYSMDDQPWAPALVLYGEGRIEQNICDWNERRSVHYDGFDDFDEMDEPEGDVVLAAVDDVEQAVMTKLDTSLEQMLACLTERQRQVIEMYYLQNMTQQKIADRLGINQRTVSYAIESATQRLKKFSK